VKGNEINSKKRRYDIFIWTEQQSTDVLQILLGMYQVQTNLSVQTIEISITTTEHDISPGQMCHVFCPGLYSTGTNVIFQNKKMSSPAPEEPASPNPKIGPKLQYQNPDLIHNTLHITYQDLVHTSKKVQDLIHNNEINSQHMRLI